MGFLDSVSNVLSGGQKGSLQDINKNVRKAYSTAQQKEREFYQPWVDFGNWGMQGYQGLGPFNFNFQMPDQNYIGGLQNQLDQLMQNQDFYTTTTGARGKTRTRLDRNAQKQWQQKVDALKSQIQQYQANVDPSYQWRLNQGLQAVNRSQAGQGKYFSGNTLTSLNDYAQGAASQEYQNQFNRAYNTYLANQQYYSPALETGYQAGTTLADNLANLKLGRVGATSAIDTQKSAVNQQVLSNVGKAAGGYLTGGLAGMAGAFGY